MKYADARVHRNDILYSDTDNVLTREQAHTVGEHKQYVLVRDRRTSMLFLILESLRVNCLSLTLIKAKSLM